MSEDEKRCLRCGRKLRTARSRELNYGPICLWRITNALPHATTQTQLEKAADLISDGGIVLTGMGRRRNQVFRVVSSNGTDRYLTATNLCTCPAGRAERLCYHRVAVAWVTA
jgi:uncharacterized Zn finger protein